jgi:hypothetical protein
MNTNDPGYVPKTPAVKTVLDAFEVAPEAASDEQKAAVEFFHKQLLLTLDGSLNSDVMIGRSVMEALDLKTEKMKNEQDAANMKSGRPIEGWDKGPNVWASTMATAALLLDEKSGASDTSTIVKNLTRKDGEKEKKPKHFNKNSGKERADMYGKYFFEFRDTWIENRKSMEGLTTKVRNLAAWDLHTGMTRQETASDAQKRSRKIARAKDGSAPNKRQEMPSLGEDDSSQKFIAMMMTDLTGDSDSDCDEEFAGSSTAC